MGRPDPAAESAPAQIPPGPNAGTRPHAPAWPPRSLCVPYRTCSKTPYRHALRRLPRLARPARDRRRGPPQPAKHLRSRGGVVELLSSPLRPFISRPSLTKPLCAAACGVPVSSAARISVPLGPAAATQTRPARLKECLIPPAARSGPGTRQARSSASSSAPICDTRPAATHRAQRIVDGSCSGEAAPG